MTEFIATCGLPGSGKSTWVDTFKEQNPPWVVIESDEYRIRLFNNEQTREVNNKLFEIIHNDIVSNLKENKDVVFDATNLSYKNRKTLLDKLAKLGNVHKTCILFATAYDICIERNSRRERQVPENVLKRMRENFNVPMFNEGWDSIEIEYEYDSEAYDISRWLKFADTYDQKNYHHSMTLGQHSRRVAEIVAESHVDPYIYLAATLHDVGKPLTQVFTTFKGEPSENAHYFNHPEVGSYESLFYLNSDNLFLNTKEILFASALINYHMRPYFCDSQKSKDKLLNTVGEDLMYFLNIIHDGDKKAK